MTAAAITRRLKESELAEQNIASIRENYRKVAERGSVLFFVISSIADLDPMYQFSLKYFKKLFHQTLETTKKHDNLTSRLFLLLDNLTLSVYQNVIR